MEDLVFTINDIRANSQIGLPTDLNYQSPVYVDNIIKCGNIISYICSFYTYSKKSLAVNLDGTLLNGEFTYEQDGTSKGIIVNDANGTNVTGIKNGTITYPETKTITFPNGWQGNKDTWRAVLLTNEETLELNGEVVPTGQAVSSNKYEQSTTIIPDGGFINGHYYEGVINIKSAPVSGDLMVEIESIKDFGNSIDFGFN